VTGQKEHSVSRGRQRDTSLSVHNIFLIEAISCAINVFYLSRTWQNLNERRSVGSAWYFVTYMATYCTCIGYTPESPVGQWSPSEREVELCCVHWAGGRHRDVYRPTHIILSSIHHYHHCHYHHSV